LTATRGIFEIEEESFDLCHLDERVISVEIGGEQHTILVEFSDHCFTEDALPGDERPKFSPSTRKDGRFCVKRYQSSLNIWEHIDRAARGLVWLGESDRCLVVKLTAEEGQDPLSARRRAPSPPRARSHEPVCVRTAALRQQRPLLKCGFCLIRDIPQIR